jgi:hypothetical protein
MFVATINVPGYLPMDDDPPTFDTAKEAWWYLYHERISGEYDYPCELCNDTQSHGPMGDCDDDTETARALGQAARADSIGTVYGPTPGYDGAHDLGLAYSVTECES